MNTRFKKTRSLLSSAFFLILTLALIFGLVYGIRYLCYKQGNVNMPIYKVDTDEKKISLSFDVAWGTDNIDDILKVLKKHEVKATFFLVGSWVDDNKELVEKIHKEGHEIGNHSNTHANTKQLSEDAVVQEIELTSDKISNITGEKTTLFRPPFGDVDTKTLDICKSLGYQVVKWDVDSMDWKQLGPNHVIERVVKNSQPGSIVLFHANINNSATYLDSIITNLKKEDYKIVPVSEMLYKENFTIDSNGVQKSK
ncbi:polysaccharide deacetylase family protein [Romboutsia lituseburensis]|uniref:Polysaccharide deacetylase family sporulation protein PdaB n=2 Tax=root TaxID=1 RepID=A0A1G9RPX7_9FIRM|nr:polysaccharide deacetylase family protein [Romboutsia lituseburensis]CEH32801.1 Polysaccharide deacetylase [Romboutsia lituseburensis]SDM25409.1 polysaccharide deacetylase family sporulation protein PdaB [Romboutsia lituseburensis DSM 797]